MTIRVNGVPREVPDGATITLLLAELELGGARGIAVAVNGIVESRASWAERRLDPGDDVLVIRATQGG